MKLPESERFIYQHNPLIEVASQLRFPTILRITSHEPVEFQDEIREIYPILEISKLPSSFIIGNESQQEESQATELVYVFTSEDLSWRVSLNRNFIAIATRNYRRYEEFKQKFVDILKVFERIYKPAFYSRIGLRYEDLIVRSELGLQKVDWSAIIPQHIAPELHSPAIASSVRASIKNLVLETDDGAIMLKHGLVNAIDVDRNAEELAYLLDADFYKEGKIGKGDYVWELFDRYNKSARNLFRWSITDRLHEAMEPQYVKAGNEF